LYYTNTNNPDKTISNVKMTNDFIYTNK
jgi:hypothetical protein